MQEETFADPSIQHTDDTPSNTTVIRERATQLASDAGAKAQQLRASATEKAGQFREYAGTKAHDIKETAAVKGQQIKQAAGEQLQQGQVKAREAHAGGEEYVRQHPTKSILTALGVGILVGLAIRR